jgi:hypothetical protein
MPASLIIFLTLRSCLWLNEKEELLRRFRSAFFWHELTTNLLIQDKKVKIEWDEPFLILRKYNGFGDELKTRNKKDTASEKEGCPIGWSLMIEVMTYFKSQYHMQK